MNGDTTVGPHLGGPLQNQASLVLELLDLIANLPPPAWQVRLAQLVTFAPERIVDDRERCPGRAKLLRMELLVQAGASHRVGLGCNLHSRLGDLSLRPIECLTRNRRDRLESHNLDCDACGALYLSMRAGSIRRRQAADEVPALGCIGPWDLAFLEGTAHHVAHRKESRNGQQGEIHAREGAIANLIGGALS